MVSSSRKVSLETLAVDDGDIDKERLLKAAEIACIKDYVMAFAFEVQH